MPKIRFKRGSEANLPILSEGEPGFTTDSKKLFVGSDEGNIEQAKKDDLNSLQVEVTDHTNRLDALVLVDANAEMLEARGTFPVLGDRLDDTATQLAEIATNVTSFGAKGDGVTDDTVAIQNALASISSGGILFFPKGTYLSGSFTIPRNVRVVGAGQYQTILKLKNGVNTDFVVFNGARGAGLENLSIDGNRQNNTAGSGVLIKNDRSDIPYEDAVSGLQIQSVHITNCKEHGLKAISPKVWVFTVRFLQVDHCDGYGIYNTATDNTFIGVNISYCSGGGIYEGGGNNRWIGAKSYINGTSTKDTGGLFIENCNRSQFSNFELQENYGHGVSIKNGKNLVLENFICDLNGYDYSLVATTGLDGGTPYAYGFYVLYSNTIKISGMTDNWKATDTPAQSTQKASYYIDAACTDIVLNVQSRNQPSASSVLNTTTVTLHDKLTESFKTATLLNSFTGSMSYRKDLLSNIMLKGIISHTAPTGGIIVGTMGTGYIPVSTQDVAVFATDGSDVSKGMARLTLHSNGNIYLDNIPTGATKFRLGGVYYSLV